MSAWCQKLPLRAFRTWTQPTSVVTRGTGRLRTRLLAIWGATMIRPHRRQFLHFAAGAAASAAMPRIARAQAYPSRQIRLVAPFPPGGAYDLVARPWSEKMKSLLGTVVVENIGGGGASIGSAAVARAQPDGYT